MANENIVLDKRDYTLQRGIILFRKEGEAGWLDPLHIKDLVLTETVEKLEHISSRSGIKVIDKTTNTQIKVEGTFNCDVPTFEVMKLFFLADTEATATQTGASLTDSDTTVTDFNRFYPISDAGHKIRFTKSTIIVKTSALAVLVENVDYEVNAWLGLVALVEGGAIASLPHVLKVSGDYATVVKRTADIATAKNIKRHVWFPGDPAEGRVQDIRGFANITPSGDFPLQADEWQEFQYSISFEKHTDYAPALAKYDDLGAVVGS